MDSILLTGASNCDSTALADMVRYGERGEAEKKKQQRLEGKNALKEGYGFSLSQVGLV